MNEESIITHVAQSHEVSVHRAQPSHALLRSASRLRLQRADRALLGAARVRAQVVHGHLSAAEDR